MEDAESAGAAMPDACPRRARGRIVQSQQLMMTPGMAFLTSEPSLGPGLAAALESQEVTVGMAM